MLHPLGALRPFTAALGTLAYRTIAPAPTFVRSARGTPGAEPAAESAARATVAATIAAGIATRTAITTVEAARRTLAAITAFAAIAAFTTGTTITTEITTRAAITEVTTRATIATTVTAEVTTRTTIATTVTTELTARATVTERRPLVAALVDARAEATATQRGVAERCHHLRGISSVEFHGGMRFVQIHLADLLAWHARFVRDRTDDVTHPHVVTLAGREEYALTASGRRRGISPARLLTRRLAHRALGA